MGSNPKRTLYLFPFYASLDYMIGLGMDMNLDKKSKLNNQCSYHNACIFEFQIFFTYHQMSNMESITLQRTHAIKKPQIDTQTSSHILRKWQLCIHCVKTKPRCHFCLYKTNPSMPHSTKLIYKFKSTLNVSITLWLLYTYLRFICLTNVSHFVFRQN